MTKEQKRIKELEQEVKQLKSLNNVLISAIDVLKFLLDGQDRNDMVDAVGKII